MKSRTDCDVATPLPPCRRWWRGKYGDVADCDVATDVAALPQLARDRGKKRREEAEAKKGRTLQGHVGEAAEAKKGRSGAKMGKREREEAKRGAQQG